MKKLMLRAALVSLLLFVPMYGYAANLITGESVSSITSTGVTINWTSAAATNSQVCYGLTSGYGTCTALDASQVTSHVVAITGLVSGNTYHFQELGIDAGGNSLTGTDLTFVTTGTAPSVTTQPIATSICAGGTVIFTSAASGIPAPTVQWQRSTTSGGGTYADISGATSLSYSFVTSFADNGFNFRAVFTNAGGSATSNVAALTVNTVPVITQQPINVSAAAGTTATFTVIATGTPTPGVQWQNSTNSGLSWANIGGATSTTLSVPSTTIAMNGYQYRAIFTTALCAPVTSSAATLTIISGKTYNISFSTNSNRSSGAFAQGASFSGNRYLFTSLNSDATNFSPTGITSVSYWLDSQTTGPATTFFAANTVPANLTTGDSTTNLELGMKFTSNVSGQITAVRFYKAPTNTGTHIGNVWSATGTLLGTQTFVGETASGWQEQVLNTPVNIVAGTSYTVSYHTTNGQWSMNNPYFAAQVTSGTFTAPVNAGVYNYAAPPAFPSPTSGYGANYWVDFKFVPTGAPPVSSDFVSPYDFNSGSQVIAFKQVNFAVPQTSQSSVPVIYTAAQTAGDLNIVVVGFNNVTSTVSSVTDTKGNTYTLAIGPTRAVSSVSQYIYYAKNIASATAGANTVTVVLNTATPFVDVRILEYAGLDPTAPLDVVAGASGASSSQGIVSSGNATTTAANELAFGAGTSSATFSAAGSGYTSRVITNPDHDIAMDGILPNPGVNNASAIVTPANWVMQMATFKPAIGILPWDTTKVSNGSHTITQVVTKTAGGTETDAATFTVNNVTHQVALTWTAGAHINPITYEVRRSLTSGGGTSGYTIIQSGLGPTAYTDLGVTSGTTYYYVVDAVDSVTALRSGFSNQVTAVIP